MTTSDKYSKKYEVVSIKMWQDILDIAPISDPELK